MSEGKIILGMSFGDEGKGLTTSYLCSITKNPLVVRFNGGHQAGHTVVHNGMRNVFSSFGSGTLQHVPTYWSKYCTFYPTTVYNEYDVLSKDLKLFPRLFVNPLCPVTTPYDVEANRRKEKSNKHGSVGVGFGTTIERHERNPKLFVQDLYFESILMEKLSNIRNYYGFDVDLSYFLKAVDAVKSIISLRDDSIFEQNYDPIFEGAQGILLDQDFGFFPNVTRSYTTSRNALELFPSKEIFYVTRTYQTRHGNGFMTGEDSPIELVNNQNETNKPHAYQGNFRTSKLDINLLRYSLQCDAHYSKGLIKNLVITCNDQHKIDIKKLIIDLGIIFNKVYVSYGDSLDDMHEYDIDGRVYSSMRMVNTLLDS